MKVGDKVCRTGPTGNGVVQGKEYTVSWVSSTGPIITLQGHGEFKYDKTRFRPAKALRGNPAPVRANDYTDPYIAKRDVGKPQFDLLEDGCPLAQLGLVQVLTWAVDVKGYKPHSWQTVPEAIKRYNAALGRHRNHKARGQRYDAESGMLHDFHILACATFIAELEARVDQANGHDQAYLTTLPATATH